MQSFDAPVLGPLDPDSSEPAWFNFFNTYSVSDTFATEFDAPEKYQHQQFSVTYEATQSPVFKSVSHDGTSSATSRIEGSGSKPAVNPSQAEDDPDNGSAITDTLLFDTWEGLLEMEPQRPHVSGHHTQNRGVKIPYVGECPICKQPLRRRDYIQPHFKRKHPSHFSSLYATSRLASTQPFSAPAAHQESSSGEAWSVDDSGCNTNLMNHWSLEQELKMPGQVQYEDGCSGASMIRQKRSMSSIFLDTTISVGSHKRSRPPLSSFDNYSRRTLACPFQKRDPSKYQKCLAVLLPRIKDVKQHIFRCHRIPAYYCAKCYEVFNTADDRDGHMRKRSCQRVDTPCSPQFGGVTEDQMYHLRKYSTRNLHERDKWFDIWDVVFPESP